METAEATNYLAIRCPKKIKATAKEEYAIEWHVYSNAESFLKGVKIFDAMSIYDEANSFSAQATLWQIKVVEGYSPYVILKRKGSQTYSNYNGNYTTQASHFKIVPKVALSFKRPEFKELK